VPGASSFWDMTSREKHICLYFADSNGKCIDKFSVRSDLFTRWDVHDQPFGLSVNAAHNVLVTCRTVCKIKEFSSDGDLLRELTLPDDVTHPYHAIQIPSREYIVCFGGPSDAVRGVCKIGLSADGLRVVQAHAGKPGLSIGQYLSPRHLAVDDQGFVFVADNENRSKRVTLLSPTLQYDRVIMSCDQLEGRPSSLHLDVQRRLLYVAVSHTFDVSSVVIFRVCFHQCCAPTARLNSEIFSGTDGLNTITVFVYV